MQITTKYDINQGFVIDGMPCAITEIDVKADVVKYGVTWLNPFTKPTVFLTEKELDMTLALNRNYLAHKDKYDACMKTAAELKEEADKGGRC